MNSKEPCHIPALPRLTALEWNFLGTCVLRPSEVVQCRGLDELSETTPLVLSSFLYLYLFLILNKVHGAFICTYSLFYIKFMVPSSPPFNKNNFYADASYSPVYSPTTSILSRISKAEMGRGCMAFQIPLDYNSQTPNPEGPVDKDWRNWGPMIPGKPRTKTHRIISTADFKKLAKLFHLSSFCDLFPAKKKRQNKWREKRRWSYKLWTMVDVWSPA